MAESAPKERRATVMKVSHLVGIIPFPLEQGERCHLSKQSMCPGGANCMEDQEYAEDVKLISRQMLCLSASVPPLQKVQGRGAM